jgi:alpha-mannosidase
MAKFEVPAHRWVDLSSPDRGLALLNDSKYGYSIHGNSLDLNLLRSPTYPDPEADLGVHHFTYSLLVHPGDLLASVVMREAGFLNQPPATFPGRRAPATPVPVTVEGTEGVELAVVKRAEKSQQLVVRLVETRGLHSQTTLRLATPARIASCDILEWTDDPPSAPATAHPLRLAPFEIRTLKVY